MCLDYLGKTSLTSVESPGRPWYSIGHSIAYCIL